ncbi:MAG: FAD-binding oxidoreductase [Acidimicrobiia bacterium]|nr:FAD-binding oxidoreductase [Acidimicrobiia bacterium]
MTTTFPNAADVVVIGGGIAGVSAASRLSERADVLLVEAEATLGYHATGRSAAVYTECTGSETVRRLARRSLPEFLSIEFLTSPKPILFVAPEDEHPRIVDAYDEFRPLATTIEMVGPGRAKEICEAIDTSAVSGGLYEPDAVELDVSLLEATFRSRARDNGTTITTECRAVGAAPDSDGWVVETSAGEVRARYVVNAAGAWGDEVAILAGVAPLGLAPLKRCVFVSDPKTDVSGWPMVYDLGHRWYFKPEGPNILGSASSEIPSPPVDARTDELDIALGIERINERTTLGIRSIKSSWAGLRTFTPDRTPAVGFDPAADGFFWLVGQGGYGIKTAPALAAMTADLILDGVRDDLADDLDPARFRTDRGG